MNSYGNRNDTVYLGVRRKKMGIPIFWQEDCPEDYSQSISEDFLQPGEAMERDDHKEHGRGVEEMELSLKGWRGMRGLKVAITR